MIRNVIFDIGNVMVDFDWSTYIHRLFDDETVAAVTRAMWDTGYWVELDHGLITLEEGIEKCAREAPGYREQIREAFMRIGECIIKQDYACPWVLELRSRGYRVYYLSNYYHHLMYSNPDALSFLFHTDGGVFSCDVKLLKPDPRIYELLCEKYHLLPEECLFIDDAKANADAAAAFGMKSVWFRSYEETRPEIDNLLLREC